MRFEKWQALGNDYLIVERSELPWELTPARVRRLCQAHFGVGADGVLLLERAASAAAGSLRIFNPDGSEAELSGNGAREAALYMHAHGWSDAPAFTIETAAGPIRPRVTAPGRCRIELGQASTQSKDYPSGRPDGVGEVEAGGRAWRFQHVSIGNPQCAIRAESLAELDALDLTALGPPIEAHELFPSRTNVSWYAPLDRSPGGDERIRARIFERGVGETLSSGTGAAGAAIAHVLAMRATASTPQSETASTPQSETASTPQSATASTPQSETAGTSVTVEVVLDGGDLVVEVGPGLALAQTGWAVQVFAGTLGIEFVEELHATE